MYLYLLKTQKLLFSVFWNERIQTLIPQDEFSKKHPQQTSRLLTLSVFLFPQKTCDTRIIGSCGKINASDTRRLMAFSDTRQKKPDKNENISPEWYCLFASFFMLRVTVISFRQIEDFNMRAQRGGNKNLMDNGVFCMLALAFFTDFATNKVWRCEHGLY